MAGEITEAGWSSRFMRQILWGIYTAPNSSASLAGHFGCNDILRSRNPQKMSCAGKASFRFYVMSLVAAVLMVPVPIMV